jgi:hypothetical protein
MVYVASTDIERYLRLIVISAWGACGRRFKSGRPDQLKTFENIEEVLAFRHEGKASHRPANVGP